jgi:hypothetical protein
MQIGVKCARGLVTHDECRKCAHNPLRPCMLTPDVLEELRAKDDDRHHDPDSFSPTYLLDCDRKAGLIVEADHYIDVEDAWPLVRGQMVHALMESKEYPGTIGVIREMVFMTEVPTRYGVKKFYGQPDLIVVKRKETTGHPLGAQETTYYVKIVDYKSKSDIGHDLVAPIKEHAMQINMYRWVVERELAKHLKRNVRIVVDELEIFYADMKKPRRFTSAGKLQTRGKMLTRSPRTYATLDLEPLPMWPIEDIEAWVVRKIEEKISSMYEELAPVLPEEDRWRCAKCPVREVCYKLEGESQ